MNCSAILLNFFKVDLKPHQIDLNYYVFGHTFVDFECLIQNKDVTEPQHVIMIPLDVRYLMTSLPPDHKRKVWQKSLFQWEFLHYLNDTMGNSW